jgi:short-subunit dehydrogenase
MKKKENILINGCSRGLGYDFINYLKLKFNVYGLSSVRNKSKNIFYYNPLENIHLDNELIKKINNIKIDHVIHCSGGGFKKHDKFLEVESLKDLFNVNFYSIYEINRLLIKNKHRNRKLNIIMIGSIAAFEHKASIGYSAAKSVLLNYNKNLAISFAKNKVITKLIIPGSFLSTKGSMVRLKNKNKKIFMNLEKLMPNSMMQKSNDIIKFSEFLLTKESDLLNGTYISLSKLESKSIFL